ncbi:MAG: hypothetical protein JO114_18710 [Planctomycetaceae bacterium]|nr:hypothetical protein [Planctomycetaceae bacterium]
MKRVFLLAAVVIVASTWARPARAQLGLLNLGTGTGIGTQLDNQKNLVKRKQKTSLSPPPVASSTRAHSSRSALITPGVDDHRFGRIDMAGKPISGYPAIRGDVFGPDAANVSRGGANGQGGRHR